MGIGSVISRAFATTLAVMAWHAAQAQEAVPTLKVALNSLQPSERGCRFTFVANNELGGELSSVAFELVLFDKANVVDRITVTKFKDLPKGKTKVRQFEFSEVNCSDIGRVLINDATECVGTDVEPSDCIRYLETETETEIRFGT